MQLKSKDFFRIFSLIPHSSNKKRSNLHLIKEIKRWLSLKPKSKHDKDVVYSTDMPPKKDHDDDRDYPSGPHKSA